MGIWIWGIVSIVLILVASSMIASIVDPTFFDDSDDFYWMN